MVDPVSIGLLLASAALSAKANNDAAKRSQAASREAQSRQLAAQNRSTESAMKRVQDFDAGDRKDKNDSIAQQLTEGLEREVATPAITAQGVQVGTTIPDAEAGGDYLKAKARETAKSTASLRALAALMGRTGAASELRRGEAVSIGDTAGDIGRIGTGANNIWGADQVGIQAAGQPSLGMQLASSALGAYGMGRMASAGVGGAPSSVGTPTGGGAAGGLGFNPNGAQGMGLRPGAGGAGLRAAWL